MVTYGGVKGSSGLDTGKAKSFHKKEKINDAIVICDDDAPKEIKEPLSIAKLDNNRRQLLREIHRGSLKSEKKTKVSPLKTIN